MSAEQHALVSRVVAANPVIGELGERFTAAGFELSLVGGSVRDALLGRLGHDLDFTTNARPDDITKLITGWADAIWDVGREFGTIAARRGDFDIEITTYRSEE